MSKFEPASLGIYIDWLRSHLSADVKPTHWYDRPYDMRNFLFATADFTTGGECGANSRNILIPPDVRHLGGALGHNQLFLFGDGDVPDCIPIYSDQEFRALPGVIGFIEEGMERDRAFWAKQAQLKEEQGDALRASDLGRHVLGDRDLTR
jgi:hypothetical protein